MTWYGERGKRPRLWRLEQQAECLHLGSKQEIERVNREHGKVVRHFHSSNTKLPKPLHKVYIARYQVFNYLNPLGGIIIETIAQKYPLKGSLKSYLVGEKFNSRKHLKAKVMLNRRQYTNLLYQLQKR